LPLGRHLAAFAEGEVVDGRVAVVGSKGCTEAIEVRNKSLEADDC